VLCWISNSGWRAGGLPVQFLRLAECPHTRGKTTHPPNGFIYVVLVYKEGTPRCDNLVAFPRQPCRMLPFVPLAYRWEIFTSGICELEIPYCERMARGITLYPVPQFTNDIAPGRTDRPGVARVITGQNLKESEVAGRLLDQSYVPPRTRNTEQLSSYTTSAPVASPVSVNA
jgi:hypothetical protein